MSDLAKANEIEREMAAQAPLGSGVEQILTLSETAGRLLQDRRSDVQRLELIDTRLGEIATGVHRLLLRSQSERARHTEGGFSRKEVFELLDAVGTHLRRLDSRLASESQNAGNANQIAFLQDSLDELVSSIASADRLAIERLDERFSAFEARIEENRDLGAMADAIARAVVDRLPEPAAQAPAPPQASAPDEGDQHALNATLAAYADSLSRLDTKLDTLATSMKGEASADSAAALAALGAEVADIKDALLGAINPDRTLLAGLPDVSEAERTGFHRIQTGFRLLLKDLTEQADAFRQKVAEFEPASAAEPSSSPSAASGSPIPVLEKLDFILQRLDEVSLARPTRAPQAAESGPAVHAAEKDSLQRVIVGFRLLLRSLTEDANTLSQAVGSLAAGPEGPGNSDLAVEQAAERLSVIADTLTEQVIAIRPTVEQAFKALPGEDHRPDDPVSTLAALREAVGPINVVASELSGMVGKMQSENASGLDTSVAETLIARIDEFVSIAVVISQDLDRLKELNSRVE